MENQITNNKSIILNLNRIETMKTNNTKTILGKAARLLGLFLVFGVFLGVTSLDVFAQVPPATTQIGNQASATYFDENGLNQETVNSNTVVTIVQQVAGVTISSGINLTVSPGGQVTFPHTITNTGNGVDFFNLTTLEGSGDFDYDNIVIYADADGNGVPDNFTPITFTPNIDPPGTVNGNTYGIVIVADIPITAQDTDVETIDVTATSNFASGESDTATNTTTVDEDAVINVQKSRSTQNVEPGDTVTYTFSYAESGNAAASNLLVKDALPSGVTYVAGSGVWSGASGIPLTDTDASETATGITYEFDNTGVADSVIFNIGNVNGGASGTLSFKVTVDTGTEGQTINNSGTFTHDDLTGTTTTNIADIVVADNFSIVAIDADTVSQGVVNQGETVNFVNRFINDGTATDTYNITFSSSDYPSGTTLTAYQATDNSLSATPTSPYTDTNSDNVVDTGPVAVGDTVVVILQVSLPSGQSGGPFSVVKTLTSINDPSANDTHVDKLDGITVPTVDITNGFALGNGSETGAGQGPETSPVTTLTTNPGTTVNYTLFINNTSAQGDDYDLTFATDTTAGGDLNNPGGLPTGWTATFRDPNNSDAIITEVNSLAAGASREVTFRVNIPAGYAPGMIDLYVKALSANSGALDIKHEAVTVNTDRSVSLTTNQIGQVSPGGSVEYIHTLTVNSNVDENNGTETDFQIALANSIPTGWTAIVYLDTDEDGNITSNDSLLTSAASPLVVDLPPSVGTLVFGDDIKFIVRVTSSTGLNDGSTVTTTLTVSDIGTVGLADLTNADQTEVQAGLLSIDKFQAPNDGVTANPGTFTKNNFNVFPGDTVWYEIVIVNDGSVEVTNISVSDDVPSYTKQLIAATVTVNNGTITGFNITEPGPGNTGTITVTVGQVDPTEQFTIRFAVKVDDQ